MNCDKGVEGGCKGPDGQGAQEERLRLRYSTSTPASSQMCGKSTSSCINHSIAARRTLTFVPFASCTAASITLRNSTRSFFARIVFASYCYSTLRENGCELLLSVLPVLLLGAQVQSRQIAKYLEVHCLVE